ncbi:type III pantothenate kinase [Snuella sedimenti]|uniref:Type III pantothenate kinase n=1 Tax=Snuella sedimenti TaxID=2798802 RepID=A0A8J7IG86_9FLAO|nr:type III pantothenate kinase [Snuella sedimenti]MBJ6366496.1 type III pantothenate kinase [Snuella sedimenti]
MNLVIDVGNSFVKLAVFNNDDLVEKRIIAIEAILDQIATLGAKYEIDKTIISSVGEIEKNVLDYIHRNFDVMVLSTVTKLPFLNLYKTPSTLGIDRIALVSAAVSQFPNKNALIIDAGTCITYDFITADTKYLGGAISPGIRMRYRSLNDLTANLPLLETEEPENLIGNSTNSAIHSGVVNGILREIDGLIEEYRLKYPDLTVILTGGDANFLSKQLKSSIFANSNFLLQGLNYILKFNSN